MRSKLVELYRGPAAHETVLAFCEAMSGDALSLREAYRHYFTDTTRWENVNLTVTNGATEAVALIDELERTIGIISIHVEMKAIATSGNLVLTERVDTLFRKVGDPIVLRVMGIFEVERDKLVNWRDYFDTGSLPS